jgi:hypothetical protein
MGSFLDQLILLPMGTHTRARCLPRHPRQMAPTLLGGAVKLLNVVSLVKSSSQTATLLPNTLSPPQCIVPLKQNMRLPTLLNFRELPNKSQFENQLT